VLAVVVGYCVLFLMTDVRRLYAASFMLIPDQLVREWMGCDVARVGLLDRLPLLAATAAILAIAAATGRLLLDAVYADRGLTRLEQIVFSMGVGLNVWSLHALAVGLMGQLQNRMILFLPALVVVPLAVWRWQAWSRLESSNGRPGHDPGGGNDDPGNDDPGDDWPAWIRRLWIGCCFPFAVLLVAEGMMPPWHFDTREYHLQVPKEWFRAGAVEFLPHNVYGNMPLGAEMHAVLGMAAMSGDDAWWWGALVGKTVIASFAIWTALGLYATAARIASPTAAALAALAFLSTPWVVHVSVSGLIDGASAFYFLLAGYALVLWRQAVAEQGSGDDAAREAGVRRTAFGRLLLSGFCAGAAVACKYPALLFLVVPLLLLLVIHRSWGSRRWRDAMVFLLAVVCASGLWFAKNAVLTGNPTYPLLYEVFGGETRTAEKAEQWSRAHRTPQNADGQRFSFGQFRQSALQLVLESDFLSPLLWPLALVGLFTWRRHPLVRAIVGFAVFVFVCWWTVTHRVDRFLLPLLPPMCLLAGLSVGWSSTRLWRTGVFGLTIFAIVLNGLMVSSRVTADNRFLVSLSDLRRDVAHESDPGWTRVHPAITWLNEHVEPGHRVLLVGEAQVFDLAVPALYNTCFDDCVFERLMQGRSAEERRAALLEHRISHVLVNWHELDRYREPGNYGYSDYVTRQLVRDELVRGEGLLRPVDLGLDPDNSELFEVVE